MAQRARRPAPAGFRMRGPDAACYICGLAVSAEEPQNWCELDLSLRLDREGEKMSRAACLHSGRWARALLVCMGLYAGANTATAAPSFTLVDLARLRQGEASVIRPPNNQGRAAGSGRLLDERGGGGRRGLLFNGGPQQIAGPGGGENATIFRINDNGDFVGSANTATAVRAFAGNAAGAVRELPPLSGDTAGMAFGINSAGQAVGFSSGPGGQRAVLWDAGGTPSALPAVPSAHSSRANDISSSGDVAGLATGGAGDRPVLWAAGGAARELPMIAGDSTGEARAVNGAGEAIGYTGNAVGTMRHAALWSATGEVTSLGALPGGEFSEAFGINDSGAVVGATSSSAGGRAFLWTRTGGMQDLNSLVPPSQVVLVKAVGINNAGAIVAIGHETSPGEQGAAHAAHAHGHEKHELPVRVFLLRPVGAP
jgi:probable HAF family extracellular repeat protein